MSTEGGMEPGAYTFTLNFNEAKLSLLALQEQLDQGATTVLLFTAKPDGTFHYTLFGKSVNVQQVHWWCTVLQQWVITKYQAMFGK